MRIAALCAVAFLSPVLIAADPPAKDKPSAGPLANLIGALKSSPGCLGVETAQTSSGKNVIFAWFENKKAAVDWYNSEVHRALMKQFFPDSKPSAKPMAGVPDDAGPILAIASVTFSEKPTRENPFPFKQISIELYQPLTGGLSIGGKFAPEKMKAPEKAKIEPKK